MNWKHLFATLALFVATFAVTGTANAAPCGQVVGDDAGLFTGQSSAVFAATQPLTNRGAFVRIRTTSSLGGQSMLNYQLGLIGQCLDWQEGSGAKSNLVLIVFAVDGPSKKVGAYWGGGYRNDMTAAWPAIYSGTVVPYVRSGDYVNAAVNSLTSVGRSLPALAPTAAPPPPVVARPVQNNGVPPGYQPRPVRTIPAPPPPVQNYNPQPAPPPQIVVTRTASSGDTSHTGLFIFLGLIVLVSVVGVYLFGRKSKSDSKSEREAAQKRAKDASNSCADDILAIDSPKVAVLKSKVATAKKTCSDADARELEGLLDTYLTAVDSATTRNGAVLQDNDPSQDGLSTEKYLAMEQAFNAVLSFLGAASQAQRSIDEKIEMLAQMGENADSALASLKRDIETAATTIASAQEKSCDTASLEASLAGAMATQENAEAALAANKRPAVKSLCDLGSAQAREITRAAQALMNPKPAYVPPPAPVAPPPVVRPVPRQPTAPSAPVRPVPRTTNEIRVGRVVEDGVEVDPLAVGFALGTLVDELQQQDQPMVQPDIYVPEPAPVYQPEPEQVAAPQVDDNGGGAADASGDAEIGSDDQPTDDNGGGAVDDSGDQDI
jgi:hypothetical protein